MKKKRIIITITIIIIGIILIYFVKVQVQNSAAKGIINNLANENYMYTKTVSSELNNEKAEIIWEGTITAEPYVGIETCVSNGSALNKIYSYEENGSIYQRMQIQSGETGSGQYLWTPQSKSVKLNQMYTAHNLKYKYKGKEKLNGKSVALYTSSYNTQVSYESNTNSDNKATLDTIVYLKFYLDMHSKEVVKIQWDESKYDEDQQVLQKMCEENLSESDARKALKESGKYKVITTINITERGNEIAITKPDDL